MFKPVPANVQLSKYGSGRPPERKDDVSKTSDLTRPGFDAGVRLKKKH